MNVCISVSFLRVLKTFSFTSSGISYLESIKEKASWRLDGCKVCKYSIFLESQSWKEDFISGWWTDFLSSTGLFARETCRCRPGVSMSVSFEETSPTLAANSKLSILFWASEQLRPSQFYNWLAFNQTQWTRGRARSVTFHWNMLKPAVKSSSTQLSIYLAMAYDLVWMWLLYYEIFNFMTLLSQFPKSCRILRMGWCPRTLPKNKK